MSALTIPYIWLSDLKEFLCACIHFLVCVRKSFNGFEVKTTRQVLVGWENHENVTYMAAVTLFRHALLTKKFKYFSLAVLRIRTHCRIRTF
jgi:hypothetical protein